MPMGINTINEHVDSMTIAQNVLQEEGRGELWWIDTMPPMSVYTAQVTHAKKKSLHGFQATDKKYLFAMQNLMISPFDAKGG